MNFQNAYDYLRWEYARLNSKRGYLEGTDLDSYFQRVKDVYGSEQKDLYESDKILFKQLKEMASNLDLPIEEQNRNTYAILNRLSENVIQVFNENNIQITSHIVLGTLPINDLNAFVRTFPNGQMLVALNEGLIQFIYFMGRVVSSFFSKKEESNDLKTVTFDFNEEIIIENLKNNMVGHSKFIETLVLYFAYNDMTLSKIYFEKDENKDLSGVLWDNAELFVVAHEYSHIVLDHLSSNKEIRKRFLDDDSSLYQMIRSWNEEFSADDLALQTVLAHNQRSGNGLFCGYLGVEFVFSCLDVIEKACNIEFSETHPSADMRRAKLRKSLERILPEQFKSILDGSKIIGEIVSNLWNTNKDTIYRLCNNFLNTLEQQE